MTNLCIFKAHSITPVVTPWNMYNIVRGYDKISWLIQFYSDYSNCRPESNFSEFPVKSANYDPLIYKSNSLRNLKTVFRRPGDHNPTNRCCNVCGFSFVIFSICVQYSTISRCVYSNSCQTSPNTSFYVLKPHMTIVRKRYKVHTNFT